MSIYNSYQPNQNDLATKKDITRLQVKPRKDEGEIPYSKYMVSRSLTDKPFDKLLTNRRQYR